MDFYVAVSIAAIIILICILVFFAYLVKKAKAVNNIFPNYNQPCPDFWEYNSSDGTCTMKDTNIFTPSAKPRSTPGVAIIYDPTPGSTALGAGGTSGLNGVSYQQAYSGLTLDFNKKDAWNSVFSTVSSDCKLTAWATTNNVLWDGVVNNAKCANAVKPVTY